MWYDMVRSTSCIPCLEVRVRSMSKTHKHFSDTTPASAGCTLEGCRSTDLQVAVWITASWLTAGISKPTLFAKKKVFLNTMASWLGWCIHVLLFVGLPLQKNSTSHNMITRQPAKPHKLVRLLAVELAECKQHHKVSDTWTGWPGRPCTESLTDLRNCHSIGQNWEEQNANAFNIIQSFYRFSNFKNWKKITHKDPWETVTTEMQERINICCKSDSEYTAVSIKYAHLTSKAYQAYHGCIKPRRHKFWKAVELRMHHHVATSHPCLQNSLCKPWI